MSGTLIALSFIGSSLTPLIGKCFKRVHIIKHAKLENLMVSNNIILAKNPKYNYDNVEIYNMIHWTNNSKNLDIKQINYFYPSNHYKYDISIMNRNDCIEKYKILSLDSSVLNLTVKKGEQLTSTYVYQFNDKTHVSDNLDTLVKTIENNSTTSIPTFIGCSVLCGIGIGLLLINLNLI